MNWKWLKDAIDAAVGYTAVEAMVVVAGIGIVTSFAAPSISHFKSAHEVYAATWEVGGMLQRVRARAAHESTPYLVLFQKEEVNDGERSVFALIVRDNDRSYSVTPPDEIETFSLGPDAAAAVRQYGVADDVEMIYPDMPPVQMDLYPLFASTASSSLPTSIGADPSDPTTAPTPTGKAKKLKSQKKGMGSSSDLVEGLVGGVASLVGDLLGGGSSGSSGSGSTTSAPTTTTTGSSLAAPDASSEVYKLEEIVMNGATFEVSEAEGVPAVAFNERGVPVSTETPTEWGTGAGAVYLTDNIRVVYAAVVSPLGEVSVAQYDAPHSVWK